MIGKIYRLYNSEASYIGSTTKTLLERKGRHEIDYKKWLTGNYKFMSSFILYMNDEAIEIELIEEIEFENKRELLDKEAYYMTQYDCLNKRIEDGKWKERKYKRQKEKIQCECGVYSTIGNISAHRKTKKHQSKLK